MYPGRPRVGRDCWIELKKIKPPRVVLRRAPRMYVVYTAQALPSPRDCRPNRHCGGSKELPETCPTSPRWPSGAVCRGGSALHNVSRAHSRWVLRSRWKGSRGLPVQSEVSSGHLRQLDYASPTLPRAEASCSRESGPEIGSRFTDSRWGGRGEREHTLFPKTKHARPSQRPSKLLECCRYAAGVLLWPSARREEVLIEAVGLNAPTHPRKTRPMTGPDCCSDNVLISTFSSERSQRGLVPALPA